MENNYINSLSTEKKNIYEIIENAEKYWNYRKYFFFFFLSSVKLTASLHRCCFSCGTKIPAAQEGSTDPSICTSTSSPEPRAGPSTADPLSRSLCFSGDQWACGAKEASSIRNGQRWEQLAWEVLEASNSNSNSNSLSAGPAAVAPHQHSLPS